MFGMGNNSLTAVKFTFALKAMSLRIISTVNRTVKIRFNMSESLVTWSDWLQCWWWENYPELCNENIAMLQSLTFTLKQKWNNFSKTNKECDQHRMGMSGCILNGFWQQRTSPVVFSFSILEFNNICFHPWKSCGDGTNWICISAPYSTFNFKLTSLNFQVNAHRYSSHFF